MRRISAALILSRHALDDRDRRRADERRSPRRRRGADAHTQRHAAELDTFQSAVPGDRRARHPWTTSRSSHRSAGSCSPGRHARPPATAASVSVRRIDLLAESGDRLDVYVEMTFHPQNTYIGVPDYVVALMRQTAGASPSLRHHARVTMDAATVRATGGAAAAGASGSSRAPRCSEPPLSGDSISRRSTPAAPTTWWSDCRVRSWRARRSRSAECGEDGHR